MEGVIALAFLFVVAVLVVMVFLHFVPIGLWISAIAANVPVNIITLIGMRMRRVPPGKIVMPLIKANKAGLDVQVNQLEAHYLAGGNVDKVVDALIAAHRAQIPLPFERSAAIAEIQSPMGTKCRNTMTTRTATTKRNANAMTPSIKNPPINPFP